MFIDLSKKFTPNSSVLEAHPLQHLAGFEAFWERWRHRYVDNVNTSTDPAGLEVHTAGIADSASAADPTSLRDELLRVLRGPYVTPADVEGDKYAVALKTTLDEFTKDLTRTRYWPHLIYAYMIENTRVYEIFQRVIEQAVHGEGLGLISEAGQRWLLTTEQLFYRDPGLSFVSSLSSTVRPDPRATRRNAYYRMFGMDLNHGNGDGPTYPYVKAEAHNGEFVRTFESLLIECWRGYINVTNNSGANTTDKTLVADLASKIQQMFAERRTGGNLAREEFVAVVAMSWFELTLASNTPIINDCKASASTAEERLTKLGQRVGIAPHSKARQLFRMASALSGLFADLEARKFNEPAGAPLLYDPGEPDQAADTVVQILNDWGSAVNRDLKAQPVVAR